MDAGGSTIFAVHALQSSLSRDPAPGEAGNALVYHNRTWHRLGDHSRGERIRLYQTMATNWRPPIYESSDHFDAVAREQGFAENLRNCWHLIRLSRHGTVELRMFGMTENVDENICWIEAVRDILRSV